jgi:hypothetical protein
MGRNALTERNWLTVENTNIAKEYAQTPTDLGGTVCLGCSNPIEHGEAMYALNFGVENIRAPMKEYLRFTGLIWHRKCFDISKLPGMAGRDVIDDDEHVPYPTPQSKMTH